MHPNDHHERPQGASSSGDRNRRDFQPDAAGLKSAIQRTTSLFNLLHLKVIKIPRLRCHPGIRLASLSCKRSWA
jgi:hypothetical protein